MSKRWVASWLVKVTRWSARHPWIVVAISVVLVGCSIVQIRRMTVNASLQAMLGADAPAAAAMARITGEYRRLDDLLVLVTLPFHPNRNSSDRREQRLLIEFAQRLEAAINESPTAGPMCRQVRFRADPSWRDFVQQAALPASALYLDDAGFEALLHRLRPEEVQSQIARNEALVSVPGAAAQAIAKAVLRDPLRLSELIDERLSPTSTIAPTDSTQDAEFSDDGRSLLIRVAGVRPASDLDFAQHFTDQIIACAAKANVDGLEIDVGGSYAIGAWTSRTIRADEIFSTVVTIILVQLFFILYYRRGSAPLLIGGTAAAGIVFGFGVYAGIVPTITPLTAVAAAMLAGLGVDYGIHFLSHYQEFRREGLSSQDASATTINTIGLALASACLTTLLGFAALFPARIAMLRDFALLGSLGLIGALITIYTLMPALMILIDRKPPRSAPRTHGGIIAELVARRPKVWITASLLILALAFAAIINAGGWPRMESDLTVMHPRPNPPLDATELIRRKFSAMGDSVPIEIRASSAEELVIAAHQVAGALRGPEATGLGVVDVFGLNKLLPNPRIVEQRRQRLAEIDPAAVLSAFDAAVRDSVFDPSAFDEYRRLLQALVTPTKVPDLTDVLNSPSLAEQILPGDSVQAHAPPDRTIVVARFSHSLDDRAARDAAIEGLHHVVTDQPGVTITGADAVAYELERTIRHDLPRTVAISLALVIVWLWIVFRRPLDVALSFIPVAFATIVALGAVAAAGLRLNAINGVAIPLLAGIAVDSGVFFVLAFRHQLERSISAIGFGVMCSAVIGTTVTNIIGFGSMYWTRTPAVRTLGIVSGMGILAGLWATLFLLLPLLILRQRRAARHSPQSVAQVSP